MSKIKREKSIDGKWAKNERIRNLKINIRNWETIVSITIVKCFLIGKLLTPRDH